MFHRAFIIALLVLLQAMVAEAQNSYAVGAQDVLRITVFGEADLTGRYRVDTEGGFEFPLIGRVVAGGLTLREVEESLMRRLSDGYLRKPQVSVEVDHYRSRHVFITGEVRTPGKYPLTGDMTVLEALAQAGSVTPIASDTILVIPPPETQIVGLAAGVGTAGTPRAKAVRVNLKEMETGRLPPALALEDGATIFVPKGESFFVTGHVRNPGAFSLEQGLTVLQALSLAGGLTDRGSDRRIRIVRIVDGRRQEVTARLGDQVRPNDTLVVPQRFF